MVIYERAYAKINLVLNVLNKRDDGYHEVDFVMDTVKLHDTVSIRKNSVDLVRCVNAPDIKQDDNLCYLAWMLMKHEFNLPGCLLIEIDKRIPVSAGMAGGSADCAATIRGINRLFKLGLSLEEMAILGAKLGSDVPFCIYSKLARATGRGELIELLDINIPKCYMVVINPGVPLSTPKVFKHHQIMKEHGDVTQLLAVKSFEELCGSVHNDLEPTAVGIEPQIKMIKDYINQEFNNKVMLSGSGPTVLVLCKSSNEAKKVYRFAKAKYSLVYLTEVR